MPLIDPQRVNAILLECLLLENELDGGKPKDGVKWIKSQGIANTFGLSHERLQKNAAEINDMLDNLPEQFHQGTGEGWSFLNACNDKNGEQWTSFHRTMDELFCLGMALGRVGCLMPREMWAILPGGMPYYVVFDRGGEKPVNIIDGWRINEDS